MSIRDNQRLRSWRKQATELPLNFPEHIHAPTYAVGDRCRWIPMPETEWGTVIGFVYVPDWNGQQASCQWIWVYLLLLDADSPSQRWVDTDWVEEEDMELLSSQTASNNFSEKEEL